MSSNDDDEAENLSPRVVHNHYSHPKNGMDNSRVNTVLLAAIIAIVGFLATQVWYFNDRLARVETNVSTLLTRP